ncbi:NAD(P)-dependent oxidoreductase [Paenibacillus sp. WQ 127069]|uniref:NAD(P)-dependent oxidoreductase n=1 Tax=Paenibacillus baimaensis TaxID=2982185 RepID=A0ABT2UB82_9BACL|nr:NAD(P)-dependent oxidoreductase [Paenibacillus sp. WQ 127069]MCU6791276.1 NAD(P)-dependent oxidoreductase [Paenibacillus sp. WQ 127069]
MNIAFVGLGTMGRHMAVNLLKAGYKLSVYNRDRRKTEGLDPSVRVVDSPGEAAQGADIVITMISDDRAVKEVYLGEGGIVPALQQQPGARTLIDCSTISPDTSLELAAHLSAIGVQMLDAPVTGSEPQAKEAQLTFIVGGDRELFESCLPLFNAMGKKAVHMGAQGTGSQTKLANNALVAITLAGLSESISLVRQAGIDPALFLEVVAGGGARSGMAEMKGPKMLSGDFSPQFMTRLMLKDLKLARGLAESFELPVPALSAVKELFQVACNDGYGDEDMSAIVKCYEDWGKAGASHRS